MVVQYQGKQHGKSTKFAILINGNNLSKTSSNYQVDLLAGDQQLPLFATEIHQSLSNCLKEVYLFVKHNGIDLDLSSEKVASLFVPYDRVLYNFNKKALFSV